jgi:hypothetical protein
MNEQLRVSPPAGMTARAALRLEYSIIALGVFALLLIFQPFSLELFGVGCALVVVAGLMNNLLPLCAPGVPFRSVVIAGLVVADIFSVMLLLAIASAHLYGAFFIDATAPDVSTPFYQQPFVWGIAVVAVLLAVAISALRKRRPADS